MEPADYLREQYTPHMQEKYRDDLLAAHEYEYYEIGGRQLPVGIYTYNLQGHTIKLIRVMDSTGWRTVIYTAKYEDGNGQATLDALDMAVRTFEVK